VTRRKPKPALPAIDRSHIVEDLQRMGELVGIAGEVGVYKVLAEVENTRTGRRWVEMIGGPAGHKQYRAVLPENVRRVTRRQVTAARAVAE
jgi:hypothetical protein